MIIIFIFNL